MIKFKRILFTLFVFLLLYSSTTFATLSNDIKGTEYEEAVTILNALEILKGYADGSFKPEETITRAEFAVIVTRLSGMKDDVKLLKTNYFDDVAADHWAAGSIGAAYDMGVISGYGDGSFKPSEPVTYEQAVKMLVSLLGYDIHAKQKGEYPSGYLVVASQKGLTKNVQGIVGSPAKRGIVAKLIYNALDIDLMKQTGFGTESQYLSVKGRTLLSENLKINKETGLVTATSDTNIYGAYLPKDDEVTIDRLAYKIGNSNAREFLGYNVVYYFKEDQNGDNRELIFVKPEDDNDIVTVNATDIDETSTKEEFKYYIDKDKKTNPKKLTISDDANVIYNGRYYKSANRINDDDLIIASGNIKFFDTDKNGQYDVILITEYSTVVVDRATKNKITFKYGNRFEGKDYIDLDADDDNYKFNILIDGQVKKVSDLVEYDVIGISKSYDGEIINIVSSFKPIKGELQEIGANSESIVINGKSYDLSKNYIEYLNSPDAEKLKIGDRGTFYPTIDNKIAAFKIDNAQKNSYGYLIKVATESGLSGKTQFQVLTAESKIIVLKGADKITLYNALNKDGKKYNANEVPNLIRKTDTSIDQLIMYELNAEGEISTLYSSINKSDDANYPFTKDYEELISRATNPRTRVYSHVLANKFLITQQMIVFNIPGDRTLMDSYKAAKPSTSADYYFDNITLYNIADTQVATVGVTYGETSTDVAYKNNAVIFDKMTSAINQEGEKILKIYVHEEGILKELEVADVNPEPTSTDDQTTHEGRTLTDEERFYKGTKISALDRGDILQYQLNELNQIVAIRVLLRQSNKGTYRLQGKDNTYNTGWVSSLGIYPLDIAYGEVDDLIGDTVIVRVGSDSSTRPFWTASHTKYYIYDSQKNNITTAQKSDIQKGDKVFVKCYYSSKPQLIVIIR